MLSSFRLRIVEPLAAAGYVILLLAGVLLESHQGWVASLAGIATLAFFAWVMSLRRSLAIIDTPTSRIGSAAQGYVELIGRALNHPSAPVLSRLTGLPCCWYRFEVMRRSADNKWEHVNSGVSSETFVLEDRSGRCLVDPEYAEVIPRRSDTWVKDDYRYREWLILPQEKVYALGQFSTVGGAGSNLDFNRDVSALLAQWKLDKANLIERFDLDQDGNINEEEWMLARQQARRDVRKGHREILSQPGTHVLHKPADGRLFFISSIDPEKLAARYRLWTLFHMIVFLAAVGIAWWLAKAA